MQYIHVLHPAGSYLLPKFAPGKFFSGERLVQEVQGRAISETRKVELRALVSQAEYLL